MATITINVPDEMLESFESIDEVEKTIYEDFVIDQRQQGSRAAWHHLYRIF